MCNNSASAGADFLLESGWNPADREPIRASVATLVFPTKSPLNWVCARWPEGSLFGRWRSGVAFAQVSCRSTRRGVREHPAPSGALRPVVGEAEAVWGECQGAPSAFRCIKTRRRRSMPSGGIRVREHPAPSGALRPRLPVPGRGVVAQRQGAPGTIRCIETGSVDGFGVDRDDVREHPAPSGALRRARDGDRGFLRESGSTQHHRVH